MLWVRISIRAWCTTLCVKVCQWLATGRWFAPGPPVSCTYETDRYDIAEILLKVALNTIKQTNIDFVGHVCLFHVWMSEWMSDCYLTPFFQSYHDENKLHLTRWSWLFCQFINNVNSIKTKVHLHFVSSDYHFGVFKLFSIMHDRNLCLFWAIV